MTNEELRPNANDESCRRCFVIRILSASSQFVLSHSTSQLIDQPAKPPKFVSCLAQQQTSPVFLRSQSLRHSSPHWQLPVSPLRRSTSMAAIRPVRRKLPAK